MSSLRILKPSRAARLKYHELKIADMQNLLMQNMRRCDGFDLKGSAGATGNNYIAARCLLKDMHNIGLVSHKH